MWLITISVDVDFELIELRVLGLDRGGKFFVTLDQRAHGQGQVAIGQAGHHEKGFADLRDLFRGGTVVGHKLEERRQNQPKRPLI